MTSYVICSGCVSSTNSMLLALAKNGGGTNDAAVSVKILNLNDPSQLWLIDGAPNNGSSGYLRFINVESGQVLSVNSSDNSIYLEIQEEHLPKNLFLQTGASLSPLAVQGYNLACLPSNASNGVAIPEQTFMGVMSASNADATQTWSITPISQLQISTTSS